MTLRGLDRLQIQGAERRPDERGRGQPLGLAAVKHTATHEGGLPVTVTDRILL